MYEDIRYGYVSHPSDVSPRCEGSKSADQGSGLGPEIAMFRIPQEDAEEEWYIKPSQ